MSGTNRFVTGTAAFMLFAAAAFAQDRVTPADERAAQLEERSLEREARAAEREQRRAEQSFERTTAAAARAEETEGRVEEIDAQMREAEERLAAAAARIAELSTRRLPHITTIIDGARGHSRPMLGITIDAEGGPGPVEGVTVAGVTPGSAAAEAGLRAGDVITAVNGEALGADTDEEANEKLVDFMAGVREGDTLDVEYLRAGGSETVQVRPRPVAYRPGWRARRHPPAAPAPPAPGFLAFPAGIGNWGDMEMVSLTEDLGRYFGTNEGLLVVRAPADASMKLRDGDVIRSIDGREPSSVAHAMRILASYRSGEELDLEIMRDRKRRTIRIEMPDNRQSSRRAPRAPFRFRGTAPATP